MAHVSSSSSSCWDLLEFLHRDANVRLMPVLWFYHLSMLLFTNEHYALCLLVLQCFASWLKHRSHDYSVCATSDITPGSLRWCVQFLQWKLSVKPLNSTSTCRYEVPSSGLANAQQMSLTREGSSARTGWVSPCLQTCWADWPDPYTADPPGCQRHHLWSVHSHTTQRQTTI